MYCTNNNSTSENSNQSFQSKPYYQTPQEMVADKTLTGSTLRVYNVLSGLYNLSRKNNFTDHRGNICIQFTQQSIAEKSGTSVSTVKRALKRLKELGIIIVKVQGFKKTNIIYFQMGFKMSYYSSSKRTTNNTDMSNPYYSSSSNNKGGLPLPDNDCIKEIITKFQEANIKLSNISKKKLKEYVNNYGNEYVSHIIDYSINSGCEKFRYFETVIESAISKGNTNIELFDLSIANFQAEKERKAKEQQELYEQVKKAYTEKQVRNQYPKHEKITLKQVISEGNIDEEFLNQWINEFKHLYHKYTGKRCILGEEQKIKIYRIIEQHSVHVLIRAAENIRKSSKYLMQKDIDFILDNIIKVYNDRYIDYEWQPDELDYYNAHYHELIESTEEIEESHEEHESVNVDRQTPEFCSVTVGSDALDKEVTSENTFYSGDSSIQTNNNTDVVHNDDCYVDEVSYVQNSEESYDFYEWDKTEVQDNLLDESYDCCEDNSTKTQNSLSDEPCEEFDYMDFKHQNGDMGSVSENGVNYNSNDKQAKIDSIKRQIELYERTISSVVELKGNPAYKHTLENLMDLKDELQILESSNDINSPSNASKWLY